MTERLTALQRKEAKEILALIEDQWGAQLDLEVIWYKSTQGKLYIMSPDINKVDLREMRINNAGLYFGELKHEELRLSIEGSQLVGPTASKGVIEFADDQLNQWLAGKDIPMDCAQRGFLLVKHGTDFLGTGRCRENVLLNFVPKARRVAAVIGSAQ
ncbi:hypothetical protein HY642_05745 [Candidatus Woesearchaeota archaeon]|nr:hypothetical protein [Candidatus Woesearchaeota archaeon]